MPYPLFKRLNIGDLEPVKMRLQLADRSITKPLGIVRDVVIRAGQLLFPADFVILDIEEDREMPLILGRPFLVTGGALINAKYGQVKLCVDNKEIYFDMPKLMTMPADQSEESVNLCNVLCNSVVSEWIDVEHCKPELSLNELDDETVI